MTRRLILCVATGKAHILHTPVRTLCGLRAELEAEWQDQGPWTGEDMTGLCRTCRATAQRSAVIWGSGAVLKGESHG